MAIRGISHKSYEQLKKAYLGYGYKLLDSYSEYSNKYKDHLTKLRCEARCGHEVFMYLDYAKTVANLECPCCRKKKRHEISRQNALAKISLLLKKQGCELLSYKDDDVVGRIRVTFTTSCGHGIRTSPTSVIFKSAREGRIKTAFLCKECSNIICAKEMYDVTRVKKELKSLGCKFIRKIRRERPMSPWIEYVARCGHVTRSRLSSIHHGITGLCEECRDNKQRDTAKTSLEETCEQLGCKLIDYKPSQQGLSTIVCSCGHEIKIRGSCFTRRNTGLCHDCVKQFSSETCMKSCLIKIFGKDNVVPQMRIGSGRRSQRIDIAVPDAHLAVEYNGVQHYAYSRFFHKSKKDFEYSKIRDDRKRIWCKKNGYTLVEVDGRLLKHKLGNITSESISQEIEKQTGHSVEYFKKILEDGNAKVYT